MTTSERYQVEQHTACDGWTNIWTEEDEHGTTLPQTFASRVEAAKAINLFLMEVRMAVDEGHMAEAYRRADFRVSVLPPLSHMEA